MEEKLIQNGWVLMTPRKGVKIYLKSKPFDNKNPNINLLHVGLLKDNNWDNYCIFSGDEMYLDEHVDAFLVSLAMKEDWKRGFERLVK